jgi:hypothetical protein
MTKQQPPVSSPLDALEVPDGWTLEVLEFQPHGRYLRVRSPNGYMATIDLEQRVFRPGMSTFSSYVSKDKYAGRGWKRTIVEDAAAWLKRLER